jgi:hypothetical protein
VVAWVGQMSGVWEARHAVQCLDGFPWSIDRALQVGGHHPDVARRLASPLEPLWSSASLPRNQQGREQRTLFALAAAVSSLPGG